MSELGRWHEAVGFLRRAIQITELNPDYWLALAESEYRLGNVVSSFEAFEKSAEIEPGMPEVWLKWSLVLFDQGNYARACDLLQAAVDEMPEEADLYYRLCVYLIHAGEYREALLNLEIALTLDYEAHVQLFDFFPDLEKQKALYRIIEQYRQKS
jgi:tetratricopeptide (TPR) repeat protein